MGYTKEAIKGISWSGAQRGVIRVITLVRYGILWRVLSPTEFGLYSLASLILAFTEILTETGVNIYLIQQKEKIESYIDSAWIVSIVRGLVIGLIIFASSRFISIFFNSPGLYSLLLLVCIVPIIRGFINPAEVIFQKNLQFYKEFWFRSSLFFIESCVAISFAFITHSVTSLIWSLIISAAVEVFLSFLLIKPRPNFSFNKAQFLDMIHKGKWITVGGVFNYLYHNGDNIIVGKLLGTSALGFYDAAYKIAMVPITEIGDIVVKVTFPVYTKLVDDKVRLRKALDKTLLAVTFLTIPIGIILFLFPELIITLFLGAKALPAAPVLRILAAFGVIRAISGISSALFYAVGKQRYFTTVTFISFMVLAISIVPLVNTYGLMGAGYSALLATLIAVPVAIYFVQKIFRDL